MATRDEIMEGIRRADAAGDSNSVRTLGAYLKSMQEAGQEGATPEDHSMASSLLAGVGTRFGNTVLGAQKYIGKGIKAVDEAVNGRGVASLVSGKPSTSLGQAGQWLVDDAESGQARLKAENKSYADANPISNGTGSFASDLIVTAPVGGVVANGVRAVAPAFAATKVGTNLLNAVASSGVHGGGLASRSAGSAISAGASSVVVDPEQAWTGAIIGGLTPGFFKLAGVTGDSLGALIRPFFASGQQKIVGDVLRQYANDPQAAIAALQKAREVVPGSAPTTAAAAGDVGLSGLTRTLQSANPEFASEWANRSTAQNVARTNYLQDLAGTPGKVAVAKEARNSATNSLREDVLASAGSFNVNPLIRAIDQRLANPNNAGQTAQNALTRIRDQLASASKDGAINARALYEIRKDAGLAMNGKLSGDASNLKYAKGVLNEVQADFDNAIEKAAKQVPKAPNSPNPSWGGYLDKYSAMSKPINQMEALQDVMKRVQTGTVDAQGNPVMSAAKLNNILKNEGAELARSLTKDQLQALRNLAADLNAANLSINSGRSVGSNTVQNLAGDRLLSNALGRLGQSTPVKATLGNALKIPYIRANQDIQGKLGSALLNPLEAAMLMGRRDVNPLDLIPQPALSLLYRSPTLLTAGDR